LPSRHRDEERHSREHNHSHRSHKSRA
jgi:hypothetical protein